MIKMRTCNCVEIGIEPSGILFELMKMHYPQLASPNIVKECQHWQTINKPIKFAK